MDENIKLKVIKTSFITKDGVELSKEDISPKQYQDFCDEMEKSRLKYKVVWPEIDKRYCKK